MILLKKGDENLEVFMQLQNENGPVDLQEATIVSFYAENVEDDTVTMNKTANITDAVNGKVGVMMETGDTSVAGTYNCELSVTYSSGRFERFPTKSGVTMKIFDNVEGV